tara:strand:+ start:715 stop:969 length:255 start_codon:yes stop_codon:yes gene_type:complete
MISKKEADAIKKLFGPKSAQKLDTKISERGEVKNRNGNFFKAHSIRDVLNQKAHSVLEDEIRLIWKLELIEREKILKKSSDLLS